MTQVALNNLWTYIQSLQLSQRNRTWLAERLIEPESNLCVAEDETQYLTSSSAMKEILDNGVGVINDEDYVKIELEDLWK